MDIKTLLATPVPTASTPQPVAGKPTSSSGPVPRSRALALLRSRAVMALSVLLVSSGVGLLAMDGGSGLLSARLTGSGANLGQSCDYVAVSAGRMDDPCSFLSGLSCQSDGRCGCASGTWDGTRCIVDAQPSQAPLLRGIRVPRRVECGPRCSTSYGFASVRYQSTAEDCSEVIPGSELYELDCSCRPEGVAPYADFDLRCATAGESETSGDLACDAGFCPSGGRCVCCNGSLAPDCRLSCPTNPGVSVADCSACGGACQVSSDGTSCSCAATCPNGAADAPACQQCPQGLIGSVCASAPNACGQRNQGEVLSSCECSAIAPDDTGCATETEAVTASPSPSQASVAPVRVSLEVLKAGYAAGQVSFESLLSITNTTGSDVRLERLAMDLDRPFGSMGTTVSAFNADRLSINPAFNGRDNDEMLGSGNNLLPAGAIYTMRLNLSVQTPERQVQWEVPLALAVSVPSTGERVEYLPAPVTLGLRKRSATESANSSGGPLEFGMLQGSVFHDRDGNGVRSESEPGLAQVVVIVTDQNGDQQRLETDRDGGYDTIILAGPVSVAVSSDNPALGSAPRFTTPSSYAQVFVAPANAVSVAPVGVAF